MKSIKILIIFCLLASSSLNVFSQNENTKIDNMTRDEIMNLSQDELLDMSLEDLTLVAQKLGVSIDELLKMKTTVASTSALTPRETPGIISIITEEEIENMGARDLIDVLRMVPGISFGYDDAGVYGIQMRGNWGFEGKVLMLMDGQELNDLKYNVYPFGQHINIHQIKRIEIIRGPGSSIYGGNAELGVINIITKDATDINGVSITSDAGVNGGIVGFSNINLNAGKQVGKWKVSATGNYNRGLWSDKNFRDYDSSSYKPADSSDLVTSYNANIKVSYAKLSARFILDNYKTHYLTDSFTYGNEFKTLLGEVKYEFSPVKNLTITPRFNYRNSIPYYAAGWYLNNSITRYTGNVTANWDISKNINIVGGVDYYYDYAKMMENTDSSLFFINDTVNGTSNVSFNNIAVYLQSIIKTKYFNITIGGRFDNNNHYGRDFAPRVGITGIWNKFHAKLLYSKAFRSPSFGNIEFESDIKAENTRVLEFEAGYKINSNMFLTANLFDISIKKPIIWYDNGDDDCGYLNSKETGTRGLEIEYRLKYVWGYGTLNYSYYIPEPGNTVTIYQVPGHDNSYLGAPNHKLTLNTSFKLNKIFNINPSAIYYSKTYGYLRQFDVYKEYKQSFLFNLFLSANIKSFEFGAGIYDIFNQGPAFVQPYQGYNFPFPSPSRQFLIRLAYNFKFK